MLCIMSSYCTDGAGFHCSLLLEDSPVCPCRAPRSLVYVAMLRQNRDLMAKHSTVTPRPYHCDIGVSGVSEEEIYRREGLIG